VPAAAAAAALAAAALVASPTAAIHTAYVVRSTTNPYERRFVVNFCGIAINCAKTTLIDSGANINILGRSLHPQYHLTSSSGSDDDEPPPSPPQGAP
jgi:hypothetical protein